MNPKFLTDPIDKLNWIASRNPNPTRTQIHKYIPSFIDGEITDCLYFEKYMLKWYDDIAKEMLEYFDVLKDPPKYISQYTIEHFTLDNPAMISMIDGMYHDIINNNMWGFNFDW